MQGQFLLPFRQDALLGASDLISYIENIAIQNEPLVATIGKLYCKSGCWGNVIPGLVTGTLDIRDLNVDRKKKAIDAILTEGERVAKARGLQIHFEQVMEADPVYCDEQLIKVIEESISELDGSPISLVSGAGHDAMAMAEVTNVCNDFRSL